MKVVIFALLVLLLVAFTWSSPPCTRITSDSDVGFVATTATSASTLAWYQEEEAKLLDNEQLLYVGEESEEDEEEETLASGSPTVVQPLYVGPTNEPLPEEGLTFENVLTVGTKKNKTISCRSCQIDCLSVPHIFSTCKYRYYRYGCEDKLYCVNEQSALTPEYEAAVGYCLYFAGCKLAPAIANSEANYNTALQSLRKVRTIEDSVVYTDKKYVSYMKDLAFKVFKFTPDVYFMMMNIQYIRAAMNKNITREAFRDTFVAHLRDSKVAPSWLQNRLGVLGTTCEDLKHKVGEYLTNEECLDLELQKIWSGVKKGKLRLETMVTGINNVIVSRVNQYKNYKKRLAYHIKKSCNTTLIRVPSAHFDMTQEEFAAKQKFPVKNGEICRNSTREATNAFEKYFKVTEEQFLASWSQKDGEKTRRTLSFKTYIDKIHQQIALAFEKQKKETEKKAEKQKAKEEAAERKAATEAKRKADAQKRKEEKAAEKAKKKK